LQCNEDKQSNDRLYGASRVRGIHIVHVHEPVLINDNSADYPAAIQAIRISTPTRESHLVRRAIVQPKYFDSP
jgi:hypothetical protein